MKVLDKTNLPDKVIGSPTTATRETSVSVEEHDLPNMADAVIAAQTGG